MKTALAIFAKTLELSPVKTRLANDVGTDIAKTFYRQSISAIEAVAQEASKADINLHPHWCIGEKEGIDYAQWQNFPSIWTGEGGLGARLANISEKLLKTHDAIIFIGTDSPQLSPEIFKVTRTKLLENPSNVIAGPAKDGGFYLFASSNPVRRTIWESVQYSTDTTLLDLSSKLIMENISITKLSIEQDVDTLEDLKTLIHTLKHQFSNLLPAQIQLLRWLETQNF